MIGYETARKILEDKTDILHVIAGALLEIETLEGSEIDILMEGGKLDDIIKQRDKKQHELEKENQRVAKEREEKEKIEKEKKQKKEDKPPLGDPGPVTA